MHFTGQFDLVALGFYVAIERAGVLENSEYLVNWLLSMRLIQSCLGFGPYSMETTSC